MVLIIVLSGIFTLLHSYELSDQNFEYYHSLHFVNEDRFVLVTQDRQKLKLFQYSEEQIKLLGEIGGRGRGPGEFSGYINTVSDLGDVIAVTTSDMWVHFFSTDFVFKKRVFTKSDVIYDLYKLNDHYLCSVMSLSNASHYGSNNFISYRKNVDQIGDAEKSNMFSVQNSLANFYLSKRYISVNQKYVVSSQEGSDIIFFIDHRGKLVNAIKLDNIEFEIPMFEEESTFNTILRRNLEKYGVTDFRMPMGGNIQSIKSANNFTLVQGGLASTYRTQSVTLISHIDWSTTNSTLPDKCLLFDVRGDNLFCLIYDNDKLIINKYKVNY